MESVVRCGLHMRKSFDFTNVVNTSWYAKHMYAGLIKMQAKLKDVDCIIEVRDSRIPMTSSNPEFYDRLTAVRPLVVVFSKSDLADWKDREKLIHYCNQQPEINRVVFANFKQNASRGVKNLIPAICEAIKDDTNYSRPLSKEINAMVIGIPNVGKSSLINAVRSKVLGLKKATTVGPTPGVTRSVLEKIKVCASPLIFIKDTPGIIMPSVESAETALKLAATATVGHDFIDQTAVADYILFRLNHVGNHKYTDVLKLDGPSDDIKSLLHSVSERNDKFIKKRFGNNLYKHIDLEYSINIFLRHFREGHFGKIMLDDLNSLL